MSFEEELAQGIAIIVQDQANANCTCGRRPQSTCRCICDLCGSRDLRWEAWGAYLDKDLVCQRCKHTQDIWNC